MSSWGGGEAGDRGQGGAVLQHRGALLLLLLLLVVELATTSRAAMSELSKMLWV